MRAVVVGLVLSLMAASVVGAQEDGDDGIDLVPVPRDEISNSFPIDDGVYSGTIMESLVATLSEAGLTLVLTRSALGPIDFEVADGIATGVWTTDGTGEGFIQEYPDLVQAPAQTHTEGTLTGKFPYALDSTLDETVTATAGPGLPFSLGATSTSSDSYGLSFTLDDIMQVCGQVVATWDESFGAAVENNGWRDPSLRTQIAAFAEPLPDDIQERMEAIVAEANEAIASLDDPEPLLVRLAIVILDAEELMSDIDSYPDSCPPDPAFLRIINQILRDVLNSLLDHWVDDNSFVQMILVRRLVEIGLRSGVLGAGAADPVSAEYLEAKVEGLLARTYEQWQTGVDGVDNKVMREALVVGTILDYQLTAISNADACSGMGGC